jgi:anaerobic magnesium-protoporphyrin IX monomethyl ester cyclase
MVNLVNPPSAPGTTANREGAAGLGVVTLDPDAFLYPPHTLATVAAALQEDGWRIRAFDAVMQEPGPDLTQADLIGVFVSYDTLDTDLAYLAWLRRNFAGLLFAFGPAMRFVGERVLHGAPIDAVLAGEAEGFCGAALRHLLAQGTGEPRVLWPADVGATCCDSQGWITDLDSIAFPAWDLLPYDRYALLTVLSSRGCPDGCVYCPYAAAQGHRLRMRSGENVLEELAWLADRFQPARVVFRDPVFAHDEQRVSSICEGMIRRELRLRWECESRPEHLNRGLLRLMQRAGCQWVKIGLETTDAELLYRLGRLPRPVDAEAYLAQVANVVRICKEIGLNCRVFVMAGMPSQTLDNAARTREYIGKIMPVALNVKNCEPYPGTASLFDPPSDVDGQLKELQQAQALLPRSPRAGTLQKARRWLRRQLRGR